jgi:hypothetical protein
MGVAAGSVCQAFHPILPGSDSSAALSVREGGARGRLCAGPAGALLDRGTGPARRLRW